MKEIEEGKILKNISSPKDLKNLSEQELVELCAEIRKYIIDVLSENPGHLASSLGTVELTVALHYLFDVPNDTLVWDVGHQAYAHKVLTGRKEEFRNIRKLNGLSGFPRRDESKYDSFGTGHASTSISASLAMALADKIKGENSHYHIAVIGDGSMTGGMAFEALNQAGATNANLLIILNDNGISIDKRVGALSQYLTKINTSATYNHIKNQIWNALGGNTDAFTKHKNFIKRILFIIKSLFSGKSNFFEALNIRYFGPINGNDLHTLIKTINSLKTIQGVKILHIITKKGKGLTLAENNPTKYHAPGVFDAQTGEIEKNNTNEKQPLKFNEVFGETIVELAKENKNLVAITPAMLSGSSLNKMMKEFPGRTFDVGIAEEHAVTLSSGFAARGIIPFCCIYSSFLQRGYDQIIHDIALQKLPVVLCLDRAGLVGEDGATHHGVFDLAYLNLIPNIIIAAPMNEWELRNMMFTAIKLNKPIAIRYPRGRGFIVNWQNEMETIEIGKGETIYEGKDIAVLSLGTIGNNAKQAVEEIKKETGKEIGLYDFRFLKPLDENLLDDVLSKYKTIITIEDGVKRGGFGWTIICYANKKSYQNNIINLGIEDKFIEQGKVSELQQLCNIDKESIKKKIFEFLN
jgi:1-deoxy-D-xylulose-5-phosphate synthase